MLTLLAEDFNVNLAAPSAWANLSLWGPGDIVSNVISLLMVIASVAFFFMLVIGGIKWIISGGDKGQTEGARNQITAALVGLVIVFSAWAITRLINAFFHVDILHLNFTFP